LLTGLFISAAPLLAQTLWTPDHFWNHESAYGGSILCRRCHVEIYKKQEASHHARTLRPAADVPEITSRLPFEMFDRTSGANLLLERKPGSEIELIARKDKVEDRIPLNWAFGSGAQGITMVGENSAGDFIEGRLTWYASLSAFDLTTGATRHNPQTVSESLGRTLRKDERTECFGCHTTVNENGIRCERCHGPGLEHARAAENVGSTDKKIFHPGKLDAFRQAQMCGACHGRPPAETDLALHRMPRPAHRCS
jgi:hypothetical protein